MKYEQYSAISKKRKGEIFITLVKCSKGFRNSLRWSINNINSVDKTILLWFPLRKLTSCVANLRYLDISISKGYLPVHGQVIKERYRSILWHLTCCSCFKLEAVSSPLATARILAAREAPLTGAGGRWLLETILMESFLLLSSDCAWNEEEK